MLPLVKLPDKHEDSSTQLPCRLLWRPGRAPNPSRQGAPLRLPRRRCRRLGPRWRRTSFPKGLGSSGCPRGGGAWRSRGGGPGRWWRRGFPWRGGARWRWRKGRSCGGRMDAAAPAARALWPAVVDQRFGILKVRCCGSGCLGGHLVEASLCGTDGSSRTLLVGWWRWARRTSRFGFGIGEAAGGSFARPLVGALDGDACGRRFLAEGVLEVHSHPPALLLRGNPGDGDILCRVPS